VNRELRSSPLPEVTTGLATIGKAWWSVPLRSGGDMGEDTILRRSTGAVWGCSPASRGPPSFMPTAEGDPRSSKRGYHQTIRDSVLFLCREHSQNENEIVRLIGWRSSERTKRASCGRVCGPATACGGRLRGIEYARPAADSISLLFQGVKKGVVGSTISWRLLSAMTLTKLPC